MLIYQLVCDHSGKSSFTACLRADHDAVMYPNVDTPFSDAVDVVQRLLPYHIFQQPHEDLHSLMQSKRNKGKEKAQDPDVQQEIEGEPKHETLGCRKPKVQPLETRFALSCHKRLRKLQERFRQLQVKDGVVGTSY